MEKYTSIYFLFYTRSSRQIRYNAETTEKEAEEDENGVDFLSEASSPSSIEDRSFFKRRKSDDEEDEEDDYVKKLLNTYLY